VVGLGRQRRDELRVVLGEEQGRVGEDIDLLLGLPQQTSPERLRDLTAVGEDTDETSDIDAPAVRGLARPQIALGLSEDEGERGAVAWVRDSAGDPALDGLGIDG
jgi:hypothetical protein